MAEQKTATKATSQPKPMTIHTCYVIDIKSQLVTEKGEVTGSRRVDESLMRATRKVCLDALKFCAELFLKEWENLKGLQSLEMKSRCEVLIHTTKDSIAKYPEFDEKFPYMPSYTRRAIVADALGIVRSYKSNHKNWEALSPAERGAEPKMGFPTIYELTFYKQERRLNFSEGVMELKLYDGTKWDWYAFRINKSESEYIAKMSKTRKLLSPVVEKVKEKYRVRFCFEEKRQLVQNECPLKYRILVVDLGINAPASWSVLTADGTVHARGVIHLGRDEDRLNRRINRKRMYQQAGKKSKNIYRAITSANQQLSIDTAKAIMDTAVAYDVDCIVFEYLDFTGKKKGRKYRERIHMWRANDVQSRVELQAHRMGMRISRVCAWGTSKYAFDGSGTTNRRSVYHYEHGNKKYNYSVCKFQNGKIYNCDLNASYNIGARFFLREYEKLDGCQKLPPVPMRTLDTLLTLLYSSDEKAA